MRCYYSLTHKNAKCEGEVKEYKFIEIGPIKYEGRIMLCKKHSSKIYTKQIDPNMRLIGGE